MRSPVPDWPSWRWAFSVGAQEQLALASELATGREDWWFQGRELYDALHLKLAAMRGTRAGVLDEVEKALTRADAHDQYAAVWLAAECASVLRSLGVDSEDVLHRYSVHARALGYQPLVDRLRITAPLSESAAPPVAVAIGA